MANFDQNAESFGILELRRLLKRLDRPNEDDKSWIRRERKNKRGQIEDFIRREIQQKISTNKKIEMESEPEITIISTIISIIMG